MAFELHITIQETSPAGQVVLRLASQEHITPEQAVTRILNDAASREAADEPVGDLFTPEDGAILEAAKKHMREQRKAGRSPNLQVAESMPIFGMFADKPEFSRAIDEVIASRSKRYGDLNA